jgi:hypothetical protein
MLAPLCAYSNSKDAANIHNEIVLTGKWVAKGGNLWLDVYTFNSDNTFSYQQDDFSMSGIFTYNNGVIILKVKEKYFSDEIIEVNEEYKYQIKKMDDSIIKIEDVFYKNINIIKGTDDWYGQGD